MREWISLVESSSVTMMYHLSPTKNLDTILANGINPTSYWAIEDVSDYYAEDFDDNGVEYVTFAVPLERLLGIQPDLPGIEEPVVYHSMGKRESQVHSEWDESAKTWQDSLDIIGSVSCQEFIRVSKEDLRG